jgi:hypothetical protein
MWDCLKSILAPLIFLAGCIAMATSTCRMFQDVFEYVYISWIEAHYIFMTEIWNPLMQFLTIAVDECFTVVFMNYPFWAWWCIWFKLNYIEVFSLCVLILVIVLSFVSYVIHLFA